MSKINKMPMGAGGIYIHIPYCKSKCGYCAFNSSSDKSTIPLYLNALDKELKEKSGVKMSFDTIYIGGGTPSVLSSGSIERILSSIKENFNILDEAEITVEANPDSADNDFFLECFKAGVNRISLGLQSDDDNMLKNLNRPHSFSDFLRAVDCAAACGITNISADLMLGLERQTVSQLVATVDRVSSIEKLSHISLYALKIEENTPFYMAGKTVDEDLQANMYEKAVEALAKNNYVRYEVSNFCKNDKKSRHNLKYWQCLPYLGFGLSAHSFFDGVRCANTEKMHEYLMGDFVSFSEKISHSELIKEYIMLSLRTNDGIDIDLLKSEYNYDILTDKEKVIGYLVSMGALVVENCKIKLTFDSYYILNSIILKLI